MEGSNSNKLYLHDARANPSLMFASLFVGLTWRFMYNKLGNNLFPVLLPHVMFDEFVFVFFMIG